MLVAAAVKTAKTRHRMYEEPTMVYYDDDYLTYHIISAQAYYQIPTLLERDIVWSSDEGYCWTRRKIQQHPG